MLRRASLVYILPFAILTGCAGDDDVVVDDTGAPDSTTSDAAPDTFGADTDADATVEETDSNVTSDSAADTSPDSSFTDTATDSDAATDSETDTTDVTVAEPVLWISRVFLPTGTLDSAATPVRIERFHFDTGSTLSPILLSASAPDGGPGHAFSLTGNAPFEGQLNRSRDGHYVTLAGYEASSGTAAVTFGSAPRVIARIDAAGTIDMTTTTTRVSGKGVTAAASIDGNEYWLGSRGPNGLLYVPHGSSGDAATTIASASVYDLVVFGDSLFGTTTATPVFAVTPPPTAAATLDPMPGPPDTLFATGLAFVKRSGVDTMYVCNGIDGAGIERWTLTSGGWLKTATFVIPAAGDTGSTVGCNAVAAEPRGADVLLAAVTGDDYRLVTIVDGAGAPTVTTVATSMPSAAVRGVCFAPY